jgi:hypothetical protein
MMDYTVIGVWIGDEPVTTGVVEGVHEVGGPAPEEYFPEGLWAEHVHAETMERAAYLAEAMMTETLS